MFDFRVFFPRKTGFFAPLGAAARPFPAEIPRKVAAFLSHFRSDGAAYII